MWLLIKLFAALTATLFIGQVALLSPAKRTSRDPTAPYLDIMPGQSVEGLKDFCQLQSGVKQGVEMGYCDFEARDGIFGRVTVVESDHRITQLTLIVQRNRLTLGDLLVCWGKPIYDVHEYPETGGGDKLYWDNQFVAHVDTAFYRKTDYFLPITYLSIEHEWKAVQAEGLRCGLRE